MKSRVEGYTRSKEAELSEQNMREEAKKAQELVERRLANKELELFRQRVSYTLCLASTWYICTLLVWERTSNTIKVSLITAPRSHYMGQSPKINN